MQIVIQRDYLAQAVGQVSKAVSSRTTIPILTGIKVAATSEEVIFTGSDADISIQASVPVEVEGKEIVKVVKLGTIVLPSKYVTEIVKKLPEPLVEIEVQDNNVTLIRSGSAEFNLNGLNADEYPKLPQIDDEKLLSLSSDLFKSMIRQTSFAVSTQESRPILTGVLWNLEQSELSFVATDSHRVALRKVHVDATEELEIKNVVIPAKSLNELNRILHDEDEVIEIVVSDNQILVKADHILFYSRLLEGTYPDTSRIIPQSSKSQVTVETKQLLQAIERASLLAKDMKHVVKLSTIAGDRIQISSNTPEVGKVVEHIHAQEISGEEVQISFNSRYMIEALKAIDHPEIQIGFTGAMSPFIIRPTENDRILHLVLPVRTY
ncbi:DNA polymerase III subunit beta [Bacillus horti]|uniref:Beta sliding clamp n=1 Tax=Caldalkalibacillus horti TaxID=77523 RepID=A0ABT9W203_9BACI|nr:DNA polymerase III subunit beta [Bacillus horti]MDQ0167102.1 DNA polymerase-3 subunit beta [Bacillus horti]